MTNDPTAPPRKKRKKKTDPPSSSLCPSFSSLPDAIILSCLARISKSHYPSLCLVSKKFCSLVSSPDIHTARSEMGATDARLYVCMWSPTATNRLSWFTLGENKIEGKLSFVPVRLSSPYCPDRLNSTTVAVRSEIYQMGGSNTDKPSRAVRVLDCRSHKWRSGPDMGVARKHADSYCSDDKIYVMGGCSKKEDWGEVFDLKTRTWKPLPSPSDDDYKIAVFGERLHVSTKNDDNNYVYYPREGRWVQEVGFQPLSVTGPCCVIGDVMFAELDSMYKWYDPMYGQWSSVYGLKDVYANRGSKHYRTIQLVNHGGKLVIIWHRWSGPTETKGIWCAVIRLKERVGSQIRGEVQRCNVVVPTVPMPFKLTSCHSVSV